MKKSFTTYVLLIFLGSIGGGGVASHLFQSMKVDNISTVNAGRSQLSLLESRTDYSSLKPNSPKDIALRYIWAVQLGNAEAVIELTEWMQERLQKTRARMQSPDEITVTIEELKKRIEEKTVEGNVITYEGLEDNLLFSSAAVVKFLGTCFCREDLEKPCVACVCFRITYEDSTRAPIGPCGLPVRSLDARLYISNDQRILKASIIGNAEIDMDSLKYW